MAVHLAPKSENHVIPDNKLSSKDFENTERMVQQENFKKRCDTLGGVSRKELSDILVSFETGVEQLEHGYYEAKRDYDCHRRG